MAWQELGPWRKTETRCYVSLEICRLAGKPYHHLRQAQVIGGRHEQRLNRTADNRFLPRLIRLRDAPFYLGMDRNRFNEEVRPRLTEIPIGTQGIAFDRLDLDAWADDYKSRNGRPGQPKGGKTWDAKERQASTNVTGCGISTKLSEDAAFARALAQANSKKRNST